MTRKSFGTMMGSQTTDTFMGLPSGTVSDIKGGSAVLGAPCATPYPSVGAYCAAAPDAIRDAISIYQANITHMDFDLGGPMFPNGVDSIDLGNLEYDEADAPGNRERIRSTVSAIVERGGVPVVLGGDDSIPIPVIDAFAGHGEYVVVQIDAHIDYRDEVGGEKLGLSSTMRRSFEMPHVIGQIQVGQRGIGSARPQDFEDAKASGVKFVSARDVAANGIQQVIDLVPAGAKVIIDLDCDALDPSIVPGVIGRAPGGLTYWNVVDLLHGISAKGSIAGFTLVEFMPDSDVDGIGALNNARIICNVLGLVARQGQA
jgi:agmatinase